MNSSKTELSVRTAGLSPPKHSKLQNIGAGGSQEVSKVMTLEGHIVAIRELCVSLRVKHPFASNPERIYGQCSRARPADGNCFDFIPGCNRAQIEAERCLEI